MFRKLIPLKYVGKFLNIIIESKKGIVNLVN